MEVLSIQVGMPRDVKWGGKSVSTGIFKAPVAGPVLARELGLEGDGQADPKYHGGRDKAVYGYSKDAYPAWEKVLGGPLAPGGLGENLTVSVLDERALGVGDVIRVGERCELEVSEPRFPCFKLGLLHDDPSVVKTFTRIDRPGIYFRVLAEGKIAPGDRLTVVRREPAGVSLYEMYRMKLDRKPDPERMRRLLTVATLNDAWRERIEKKLGSGAK